MNPYYAAREAAGMGPDAPWPMVCRAVARRPGAVALVLGLPAEADADTVLAALAELRAQDIANGRKTIREGRPQRFPLRMRGGRV